jgi:acetyltransferase-like isoleucine patch superfamily enzyme
MNTSFYSRNELELIGLKAVGEDVFISRNAKFYSPETMSIGNNVRIDDFCILSGVITIGSYIHISASTILTAGQAGIEIGDFANISQRVNVFANSDDYSGQTMTNPMIPGKFKKLEQAKVTIKRHSIIGCGTVVMPGVTIEEGTAIGAMCFVDRSTKPWTIYAGIPAKAIKERSRELLRLEEEFLAEKSSL